MKTSTHPFIRDLAGHSITYDLLHYKVKALFLRDYFIWAEEGKEIGGLRWNCSRVEVTSALGDRRSGTILINNGQRLQDFSP